MNLSDYFQIVLLCALILIALIGQQYYLIKASINRIYRAFMWIASVSILVTTFLKHTDTHELIYGIIYTALFLVLSFMRKGITQKGLSGIKGDSCKWSKINSVKLLKHNNKIKLVYLHSRGESYMYFDYNDYSKLIKILRQFLSYDKINIYVRT
ncbi:hypothetical protein UT300007_11430 [Clostridium sp. CTA-7]